MDITGSTAVHPTIGRPRGTHSQRKEEERGVDYLISKSLSKKYRFFRSLLRSRLKRGPNPLTASTTSPTTTEMGTYLGQEEFS